VMTAVKGLVHISDSSESWKYVDMNAPRGHVGNLSRRIWRGGRGSSNFCSS